MKKRIGILVLILGLMMSEINVQAAEKSNTLNFNQYFNLFIDEVKGVRSDNSITDLKHSVGELIKNIKPEDANKILNFVEKKIQDGSLESEQGVKDAIAEGEKEFGVTLTKDQKDMILSVTKKIKSLGIDPQILVDKAEETYEKYGNELKEAASEKGKEIIKETQNKIKEEVTKSLTDYFSDMMKSVTSFFKGIFGR